MLFRAHGELQEAPRIAGGDDGCGVSRRSGRERPKRQRGFGGRSGGVPPGLYCVMAGSIQTRTTRSRRAGYGTTVEFARQGRVFDAL